MSLYLGESRYLRYFSFTILYVAQGFPFGLVTVALPAFLLERGASPAAVGAFVGGAMLPWTFKWLAGPMMDRFTFLSMGRRRPWVLLAQLGLVITGLAFAFFQPPTKSNFSQIPGSFSVLTSGWSTTWSVWTSLRSTGMLTDTSNSWMKLSRTLTISRCCLQPASTPADSLPTCGAMAACQEARGRFFR